ncbi:MAG: hypothetical protein WCJ02_13320, partial [bacterium]
EYAPFMSDDRCVPAGPPTEVKLPTDNLELGDNCTGILKCPSMLVHGGQGGMLGTRFAWPPSCPP